MTPQRLTELEQALPDSAEVRTYHDALAIVRPLIRQHGQYGVVATSEALRLMGEARFARFVKDKIIGIGPRGYDGFYYWNVAAGMVKVWDDFPPIPAASEEERT